MGMRVALRLVALLFLVTFLVPTPGAEAQFAPGTKVHRSTSPPLRTFGAALAPAAVAPSIETPYHNGATLHCSDCHTMHYSETHDLAGNTPSQAVVSLDGGPTAKLLRKGSALDLCLACHDGRTGVPDVLGADSNALAERAAGFFGNVDQLNYRGHNLQRAPDAGGGWGPCSRCHFGGSMGSAGVTCIDCHAKHGNGNYRNLQWASDPGGEPRILALTRPGTTGMNRYDKSNVGYLAPAAGDGSYREVTNICIDCHHSFMDDSAHYYTQINGKWVKHPGTNSEWGAYAPINRTGANTDPTNWTNGPSSGGIGFTVPRVPFLVTGATDFATATTVAANNEIFCLSCHKAHGSDQAFSNIWNYGGANPAGCQQCHNR